MTLKRPAWYWRDYFEKIDPDIVALCDAIADKNDGGLGLIWLSTDFDAIFERLDRHPDNWVVGQARDQLRANVMALRDVP